MTTTVSRLIAFTITISTLLAQAPLQFEVAYIKRNISTAPVRVGPQMFAGGRVVALKVTVNNLMQTAYGVRAYQVSGDPEWARSEFYNIEGRIAVDRKLTYEEAAPAWQALLADRFQLKLHRETRDIPAYALVVAKNGPKMKQSGPDDTSQTTLPSPSAPTRRLVSEKITMARLALILAAQAGRPVIDKTGLDGNYSITLEWAADDGTADAKPDAPALVTAIQEQLGLRLYPQKLPMEVLVVDHLESPSEN
jgi:uncharacterized protein (TIGR03435 family)